MPSDARGPTRPFIAVEGITKAFGAVVALRGVGIAINPGEIVSLAGENGSGKSTLSRILAGVMSADAGVTLVDGEIRRFSSPRAALEHGIALVSQEPTAVADLSVGENVMLPFLRSAWRLFHHRRVHEAAQQFLDRVGLNVDPRTPLRAIRAGERELVEVAKALATRPRLLILDEATARLPDPSRLFGVIRELREDGVSTLFITHRLGEIEMLADRVVVLRDGRVTGELRPPEIRAPTLSRLMVGRELDRFFGRRAPPDRGVALEVTDVVVEGTDDPISFSVRGGEIVGLSGLIGAGRTELLETLIGARRRHGGSVLVHGQRVPPGSVRAAIDAGIALVPEDRLEQGLFAAASIHENITMGSHRALSPARRGADRQSAISIAERLGVRAPDIDAPVVTLSGGNQQKVVLARALTHNPKVLLLDEPTRGLDIGAKADLYETINGLSAQGVAAIVASSEMIELLGLCDRIIVMHQRRIVGDLPHESATEDRIALLSGGVAE